MFAYVSCRPDIGYAITLLSRYGSNPNAYQYNCLRKIAMYLRGTKKWGIIYKRQEPRKDLEDIPCEETVNMDDSLPKYPRDELLAIELGRL